MSGIAKLKKVELRIVAEEIGLVVNEGMKKSELRRLIEDSDVFKNDNEAVKSAVEEDALENRNKKSDQDSEIEIERLKIERIKLELQLAQVKANGNNTSFDQGCKSEPEESLDSLIKSVRTLTIKPPKAKSVLSTKADASDVVNNSPSGGKNTEQSSTLSPNEWITPFVGTNLIENKNVILSTVKCLIKDRCSQWQEVRCMLDVGSQICIMTKQCLQRWGQMT
ncbi:DUF1758 domain-containing protein [Nephila pilipes]|uniref:DUF1758 domain-containing protein n=1 Tax=Nephila pilipes TaxID=299642 RepID=A0A8X6MQL9_NEPPI|nr:DUF1758 domain-containing protein [Nephila pilipes]